MRDNVACPWDGCEREFETERGMKLHHRHDHAVPLGSYTGNSHYTLKPSVIGCDIHEVYDDGSGVHELSEVANDPHIHECPYQGCNKKYDHSIFVKKHYSHEHGLAICDNTYQTFVCDDNLCVCHRIFFSERDLKHHYAQVRLEDFNKYECMECADTILRPKSRPLKKIGGSFKDLTYGYYCNRCNNDVFEDIECTQCGSQFNIHEDNIDDRYGNFCKPKCKKLFNTITVECEYSKCNKSYSAPVWELSSQYFCCVDHEKRFYDEKYNYNNYNTSPSRLDYGSTWPRKREERKTIDDYTCLICGMDNDIYNNIKGRDLDVHHLIKVRSFDDPNDAHYMENLRTVCRSCHSQYESHAPFFPVKNIEEATFEESAV